MKRTIGSVLLLALVGSALAGCVGKVTVRDQAAADFTGRAYRTYHILDQPVGREPSLDAVVREGLAAALDNRGYQRAPYGSADLIVSHKVLLDQAVGVSPTGSNPRAVQLSGQPRALWAGEFPGEVMLSPEARDESRRKILLVMLQEARTHRVVWLGWSHMETNLRALRDHSEEALASILERLPPRS